MNKCIFCESATVVQVFEDNMAWVECRSCGFTGPAYDRRNEAVQDYNEFEKIVRFGRLAARICPTCDTSQCKIKERE